MIFGTQFHTAGVIPVDDFVFLRHRAFWPIDLDTILKRFDVLGVARIVRIDLCTHDHRRKLGVRLDLESPRCVKNLIGEVVVLHDHGRLVTIVG
ncbi:hypothetical protein D3C73_1234900 [compost metagenome]